ncbi:MAG: hypothetical protein HYR73_04875 [Candidatus Eisenbacteria bacterium]|nr:hypothetical protein [Candidatus Eisenbacteria bacterium]
MRSRLLRRAHRARRRPQWRRWLVFLVGLAALLVAPMLAHAGGAAEDSVKLSWTAPGDDGAIGAASLYELRISATPIDASNWSSATLVPGVPAPRSAGTVQSFNVTGLTNGNTYYFAIRAEDDAGNWSGLSNVLRWDWVVDTAPPAAPGGVTVTRDPGDVHVHWSPNAEPDLAGYTVYRATSSSGPYTALNGSLLNTTDYYDSTVPSGTSQVWYEVTASDQSANQSARSGAVGVTLTTTGTATAGADWSLETGYPNPSSLSSPVTIPVVIPASGGAGGTIVITDDAGHQVRQLSLAGLSSGRQLVTWDGKNDAGRDAAPGVYRVSVMAGGARSTVRLVRVP